MRTATLVLIALLICSQPLCARCAEKIPLNVLYLGRQTDEKRTEAFVTFLSSRFRRCTAAKRDNFQEALLAGIDVVLIDWSQQERSSSNYSSPVGDLETWQVPTVLLGSAGHLIAGPWSVIGGSG